MVRWEFDCVKGWTRSEITARGEDGWELVAVTVDPADNAEWFYFKRPLEKESNAGEGGNG